MGKTRRHGWHPRAACAARSVRRVRHPALGLGDSSGVLSQAAQAARRSSASRRIASLQRPTTALSSSSCSAVTITPLKSNSTGSSNLVQALLMSSPQKLVHSVGHVDPSKRQRHQRGDNKG